MILYGMHLFKGISLFTSNMKFNRKIFLNKRTGQASIILPKKKIMKFWKSMPDSVVIDIKPLKKGKKLKW